MPSRDSKNRIRPPSFRAKLSSMKGLTADEKALFQRIGNLVDVLTFSQRQENNPGTARSRKLDDRIPTPQNIVTVGTFGGLQMSWDPVDFVTTRGQSDGVAFYEVQFSETSTFATFNQIEVVGTRTTIKQDTATSTIFVRVRTVSKRGLTSSWSSTSSVSIGESIFSADQDSISPENRTTVQPMPTLLGTALDNSSGGSIFTGIGATVGPSPINLDDNNSGTSGNLNIRHDVTYVLHLGNDPFPGLENQRLETVGQEYLEQENFYTFDPSFYIRPQIVTGSFTDFFETQTLTVDPVAVDVQFLRYRILGDFYFPDHPQAGYVLDASMSTLKF
ncbi:MAG: hypothetical protein SVK08_00865 [Halobacteriota archaeon]|nr:hypothetical protein [Halobacteriota archaeon]